MQRLLIEMGMFMDFKFEIGEKVKISVLNCEGRILSIWIVRRGLTYEVRYFFEGKVVTDYFYEDELLKL